MTMTTEGVAVTLGTREPTPFFKLPNPSGQVSHHILFISMLTFFSNPSLSFQLLLCFFFFFFQKSYSLFFFPSFILSTAPFTSFSAVIHSHYGLTCTFLILIVVQLQIMSDSLQPHRLQQDRLSYSSLSTRVCSNSCPLSQ